MNALQVPDLDRRAEAAAEQIVEFTDPKCDECAVIALSVRIQHLIANPLWAPDVRVALVEALEYAVLQGRTRGKGESA